MCVLSSEDDCPSNRIRKGKCKTAGTGSEMRCEKYTQVVLLHFLHPLFLVKVNCLIIHASLN